MSRAVQASTDQQSLNRTVICTYTRTAQQVLNTGWLFQLPVPTYSTLFPKQSKDTKSHMARLTTATLHSQYWLLPLVAVSHCCDKTLLAQAAWRRKRLISSYTSRSQSIFKGSQGRSSRQEPGSRNMERCCFCLIQEPMLNNFLT